MKVQNMSEPISTGAAGVIGWKALTSLASTGAVGAALAAIVVMSMTKPKTEQEWRVGIISTVVGSIGGGAVLARWLGIQHWADDPIGLVALLCVVFACGLPAWALVRALFRYLDKHKDDDLVEVAEDLKKRVL